MKSIKFTEYETFKTRDVIRTIIEIVPPKSGGVSAQEMRSRIRLLDRLDAATGDTLELEDADHARLVHILSEFKFGVVHRELSTIIDAIETAQEPPVQNQP